MGGSAFSSKLSHSAFPRLPPAVYADLKARLLPKLQGLYSFVAVPREAPEKNDYGDLDFIVAGPKVGVSSTENTVPSVNVPHEILEGMIGAQYANLMEGNRTSNFAVAIRQGEWEQLGHGGEEFQYRSEAETGQIYYQVRISNIVIQYIELQRQVDINVCADQAEWERVVFFHGYGDLGMILGVIMRNVGMALGTKGLKLPNPPHPPMELSNSFDEIIKFMGLSMTTWKIGFASKREVFEWAGTSKFFTESQCKFEGERVKKVKPERKMYAEFIQWALERTAEQESVGAFDDRRVERQQELRDEALKYFGKKEEFDALVKDYAQRIRLKQTFTGPKVRDWTGLGEYWKGVKLIMDAVRLRVGGEEGVLRVLDEEGEDGLRKLVLDVKDELGIISHADLPVPGGAL